MGRSRFYFYDAAGTELTGYKFNGAEFTWTGAYVPHPADHSVMARAIIEARHLQTRERRFITMADFPGHEWVRVKFWYPGSTEMFDLVKSPAARESLRGIISQHDFNSADRQADAAAVLRLMSGGVPDPEGLPMTVEERVYAAWQPYGYPNIAPVFADAVDAYAFIRKVWPTSNPPARIVSVQEAAARLAAAGIDAARHFNI